VAEVAAVEVVAFVAVFAVVAEVLAEDVLDGEHVEHMLVILLLVLALVLLPALVLVLVQVQLVDEEQLFAPPFPVSCTASHHTFLQSFAS